jgi:hypothetical protein
MVKPAGKADGCVARSSDLKKRPEKTGEIEIV